MELFPATPVAPATTPGISDPARTAPPLIQVPVLPHTDVTKTWMAQFANAGTDAPRLSILDRRVLTHLQANAGCQRRAKSPRSTTAAVTSPWSEPGLKDRVAEQPSDDGFLGATTKKSMSMPPPENACFPADLQAAYGAQINTLSAVVTHSLLAASTSASFPFRS